MNHFLPQTTPDEGTGVLFLFHLVDKAVPAFFAPDAAVTVARAPGCLEVLGGIGADDSALVLQVPLAEAACVAVQGRDDDQVHVWSPCRDDSRAQLVSIRLADLGLPDAPVEYQAARTLFRSAERSRWAAHLFGCLLVLARERAVRFDRGLALLLHCDVPSGRGLGASTAIEVATMRALCEHLGLAVDAAELAQLSRRVAVEVLGARDGAAPALAAVLAEQDEVLALRGGEIAGRASALLPADLELVAIDSGVRPQPVTDPSNGGDAGAGAERFLQLLQSPAGGDPQAVGRELGDLLFAAHASASASGLGNATTDFVVDQVRQRRALGAHVHGARATGIGGGTVVILGDRTAAWHEALRVKKALLQHTGHSAEIQRYSSPGALAFGTVRLEPKE